VALADLAPETSPPIETRLRFRAVDDDESLCSDTDMLWPDLGLQFAMVSRPAGSPASDGVARNLDNSTEVRTG